MIYRLVPHPATPSEALSCIDVQFHYAVPQLDLCYRLAGDIAAVVIPPRGAPLRADRLWEQTCFEMFLGNAASPAYVEFNFSPSAQWAAYGFDAYRIGMRNIDCEPAPIDVTSDAHSLTLSTAVNLASLRLSGTLRLALSAVIEERSGAKSYWALKYPGERPDFHHSSSFISLDLP